MSMLEEKMQTSRGLERATHATRESTGSNFRQGTLFTRATTSTSIAIYVPSALDVTSGDMENPSSTISTWLVKLAKKLQSMQEQEHIGTTTSVQI